MKGSQLTQLNFDKSQILKDLIKIEYNKEYKLLLGELQFCFVIFVLGENFSGFEQWKKLLILITSC